MDKISIIIPVYNVEKYLRQCLFSITRQTYKYLEIILVDDGPTDSSGRICDEYAKTDRRITVIHKNNGGLSSARNAGLQVATGKYIGFVDSDDWVDLQMYEDLYQLLLRYRADVACSNIKRVRNRGKAVVPKKGHVFIFSRDQFAKKYFKIHSNDTVHYVVNKLYKAEIARKMRFPEGLINEDVEGFFYALLAAKKIVVTDKCTYYYRVNPESISATWFSHKQMDLLKVWKHVVALCKVSSEKDWAYYARINYYRAHFGLLCRLLLNPQSDDVKYKREQQYLLYHLKIYYWELIKAPICLKRKILVTILCVDYEMAKKIFRLFHFKNHRR